MRLELARLRADSGPCPALPFACEAAVAGQRRLGLAGERAGRASRRRDHRDPLGGADVVALGEVLGQVGEPVVPVVADRLVGGDVVGRRRRLVEGLAQAQQRRLRLRLARPGCAARRRPGRSSALIGGVRSSTGAPTVEGVVQGRQRRPQRVDAGPQAGREVGEVDQERALDAQRRPSPRRGSAGRRRSSSLSASVSAERAPKVVAMLANSSAFSSATGATIAAVRPSAGKKRSQAGLVGRPACSATGFRLREQRVEVLDRLVERGAAGRRRRRRSRRRFSRRASRVGASKVLAMSSNSVCAEDWSTGIVPPSGSGLAGRRGSARCT